MADQGPSEQKRKLAEKAKIAEQAERYEDMAKVR